MTELPCSLKTKTRLDAWLWRARFYKSRALCTKTLKLGKVRLQRKSSPKHTMRVVKPNTVVTAGDRLTFIQADKLFYIEIRSVGNRRGPPQEALTLYRHLTLQKAAA